MYERFTMFARTGGHGLFRRESTPRTSFALTTPGLSIWAAGFARDLTTTVRVNPIRAGRMALTSRVCTRHAPRRGRTWLFVNLDGNAPRFEEYIESILIGWGDYAIADIRCAHHLSVDYNCNWKLAIENYSDFYHVFRVHPALDVSLGDTQRTAMICEGAVMHNQTRTNDAYSTISSMENAPRLPDMGGFVEDGMRKTVFGVIFPNTAVNIEHSDVQLSYFEPLGPTRTRPHRWFYFRGDAATDPQFHDVRQRVYDDWERVLREDEEAWPLGTGGTPEQCL